MTCPDGYVQALSIGTLHLLAKNQPNVTANLLNVAELKTKGALHRMWHGKVSNPTACHQQ